MNSYCIAHAGDIVSMANWWLENQHEKESPAVDGENAAQPIQFLLQY